ncbi:hypothetical protein LTR17_020944 [Elasticomyces elasticus]|nr:hypothetical protein LTR17_020944 [Elasticomyces elasticus]
MEWQGSLPVLEEADVKPIAELCQTLAKQAVTVARRTQNQEFIDMFNKFTDQRADGFIAFWANWNKMSPEAKGALESTRSTGGLLDITVSREDYDHLINSYVARRHSDQKRKGYINEMKAFIDRTYRYTAQAARRAEHIGKLKAVAKLLDDDMAIYEKAINTTIVEVPDGVKLVGKHVLTR